MYVLYGKVTNLFCLWSDFNEIFTLILLEYKVTNQAYIGDKIFIFYNFIKESQTCASAVTSKLMQ